MDYMDLNVRYMREGLLTQFTQCIKLAEMSTGPYGPVDCMSIGPFKKPLVRNG